MKRQLIKWLAAWLLLVTAAATAAPEVPNGSFEEAVPGRAPVGYIGKCVAVAGRAHAGEIAVRHDFYGTNWEVFQTEGPFIACKPDTWYRFTVWNRNTVPTGDIYFGVRQCESTAADTESIVFDWARVKTNIPEWAEYAMEFKTSARTHGLSLYARVAENVPVGSGEVFWDDFRLEEIEKEPDPMIVRDFAGVVTPVAAAMPVQVYEAPRTEVWQGQWRPVDPAAERLTVELPRAIPGAELAIRLTRRDSGAVVRQESRRDLQAGENCLDLDLPTLAEGVYDLTLELRQDGKALASAAKTVIRSGDIAFPAEPLAPITRSEVDQEGNLLVNGEAFLPVFYGHFDGTGELAALAKRQYGINMIHIWHDVPDFATLSREELVRRYVANFRAQLDQAQRDGFYVMVALFRAGLINHQGFLDIPAIAAIGAELKDHPALIGFDLVDEPECYLISGDTMRAAYRALKEAAPERVVWVNLCYRDRFEEYAGCSDFASFDHYPVPAEPLAVMSDWNRAIQRVFPGTAFISYMQAYNPEGFRLPSYEELRAMMYLNIADGSKSLVVYSWVDPYPMQSLLSSVELQGYYRLLGAEFTALAPFLTAPTPAQPAWQLPGPVRWLYKENGCVLVNLSPDTVYEFEIDVPGGKMPLRLEAFECRYIPFAGAAGGGEK